MDLSAFLKDNRESGLAGEFDYQGLFSVSLGYLGQRRLMEAKRRAVMGVAGDGEAGFEAGFRREVARLVQAWRGLNLAALSRLTDVALPAGADPDQAVDCTPDNVAALMAELPEFMEFVIAKAGDLEALRRQRAAEERKN